MIYLIISILTSTLLGFIFKFFPKYNIDTFQAIVINYLVCVLCGWYAIGSFPINESTFQSEWFPYAFVLGFLFISGFNIGALTMQKFGVTIGTVMMKMSIILSATYPILFFGESSGTIKIIGILLSIIAIILVNKPKTSTDQQETIPLYLYILPFSTWLISGIIEILLFQVEKISGTSVGLEFTSTLFGVAFLGGFLILTLALITGRLSWSNRNVLAGIILGVPNFLSIYYLFKILGIGWEGSVVFPINNVAIISLAAILSYFALREKLSTYNIAGVILAAISIMMFALGH